MAPYPGSTPLVPDFPTLGDVIDVDNVDHLARMRDQPEITIVRLDGPVDTGEVFGAHPERDVSVPLIGRPPVVTDGIDVGCQDRDSHAAGADCLLPKGNRTLERAQVIGYCGDPDRIWALGNGPEPQGFFGPVRPVVDAQGSISSTGTR